MKKEKKCLALLQGKGLQELSTKEITGIYGGITKTEAWVAGFTIAYLLIGASAACIDFEHDLARASAAKQYLMNVELQPRLGESFANRKLPDGFASLQELKAYHASGGYQDLSKYLNKNGSIKSMSAMQYLGHAVSEYAGCVSLMGAMGSLQGLEIGCIQKAANSINESQQENTQANEAR